MRRKSRLSFRMLIRKASCLRHSIYLNGLTYLAVEMVSQVYGFLQGRKRRYSPLNDHYEDDDDGDDVEVVVATDGIHKNLARHSPDSKVEG